MTRVDLKRAGILTGTVFATLAFGIVAGSSAARAQEDTTGVFMRDMLGSLGIIEKEAPSIDYRERAPLVIPPNAGALPPPRSATSNQSNWPSDPDVAARQRAIEAANAPVPMDRDKEAARPLTVDEIRAGRRAGGGGQAGPPADGCHGDSCSARPLDPRSLRATAPGREPPLAHGQEPARSALTQPPTGYRLPTSAPLPETEREPVVREDTGNPFWFINRNRSRE